MAVKARAGNTAMEGKVIPRAGKTCRVQKPGLRGYYYRVHSPIVFLIKVAPFKATESISSFGVVCGPCKGWGEWGGEPPPQFHKRHCTHPKLGIHHRKISAKGRHSHGNIVIS